MGNPGCFISMHEKGNRAKHTTEQLVASDDAAAAAKAARLRQIKARQRMQNVLATPAPEKRYVVFVRYIR